MKVRVGSISDADRDLIFGANRDGKSILVAATEAFVRDSHGLSGPRGAGQYVGIPQSWTYDVLRLGPLSGSFATDIPWEEIRAVWLRNDAPESEVVDAEYLS